MIENDYEFYEQICSMYNLKYMKMIGPSITHEFEYVVENMFWRDFEKHLGSVSEEFVLDKYPDELYLENNDPVELEMDDDKASEIMKDKFSEWVKNTLDKKENFETINNYIDKKDEKLKFSSNDFFLQFN